MAAGRKLPAGAVRISTRGTRVSDNTDMAAREATPLVDRVRELLDYGGPVSFLDAMEVVDLARPRRELSEAELGALLALHDAESATIGAREVLGEFLCQCAKQMVSRSPKPDRRRPPARTR